MKNNYLLVYNNNYSLEEKIKAIIPQDFNKASKNIYDLEEQNLSEALLDLDTYSFLTEKKIIIIKNIDALTDDKNTKHLLKYLDNPNPDNLLILTTKKFNSTKKINKDLKSKTNYFKLEADLNKDIKELLKDYKIAPGVITKLIEYSNNNIDIIKTECEKLKQYKFTEKEITKEDIESIVVKHLSDSNQHVFDLIRDISSNNKKDALLKYQSLEKYNIDDISLIGLLESQLRLMVQVSLLMDKNYSKKDISNKLDIHPYRIEKTIELLRYSNMKDISKLIKNLSELDYKIKSGQLDNNKAIFMYIINM